MSTEATPEVTTATVPATQPAAPVAPAPPAHADDQNPAWLKPRLDQKEAAVLKAAGFESMDEAKAAKAELDAKRNATKTAEQKAAETQAKLDAESTRATALLGVVGEYAGRQMMALTAEQQTAVKTIAGDDPAAQLKAIGALQTTWNKPAPAAAPLANTAPAGAAPAAASTSEVDHKVAYAALKETNPFAAAAYAMEHAGDILKPA